MIRTHRTLAVAALLILFSLDSAAQTGADTIEVRKKLSTTYRLRGRMLTPSQLLDHTRGLTPAYDEMRLAKKNYDWGYGFGFAGGFLVGWPLGTAVFGGKPNWALAGIGAGLIGVSIPFSSAFNRHAKRAVRIFNDHALGR